MEMWAQRAARLARCGDEQAAVQVRQIVHAAVAGAMDGVEAAGTACRHGRWWCRPPAAECAATRVGSPGRRRSRHAHRPTSITPGRAPVSPRAAASPACSAWSSNGPQSPPHQLAPAELSSQAAMSAQGREALGGMWLCSNARCSKPWIHALKISGCGRSIPIRPSHRTSSAAARPARSSPRGRASRAGSTCWAKVLVTSTCMVAKSCGDSLPMPSSCRTRRARQSPKKSRPMKTGKSGGATRSLVLTMCPLAGSTTCGRASPLAQPTQSVRAVRAGLGPVAVAGPAAPGRAPW